MQLNDAISCIFNSLTLHNASRQTCAAVISAVLRTLHDINANQGVGRNQSSDLQDRQISINASIEAQQLLGCISGQPSHNLGTAILHSGKVLPKSVKSALTWLRKHSNSAKHEWEPGMIPSKLDYSADGDYIVWKSNIPEKHEASQMDTDDLFQTPPKSRRLKDYEQVGKHTFHYTQDKNGTFQHSHPLTDSAPAEYSKGNQHDSQAVTVLNLS